jgi:hypothetical protein
MVIFLVLFENKLKSMKISKVLSSRKFKVFKKLYSIIKIDFCI